MDIQATDEYKALEIYLQKAQEEIGRALTTAPKEDQIPNGCVLTRHHSLKNDSELCGNHSYLQHVGPKYQCKRRSLSSVYDKPDTGSSKELFSQRSPKRHSDPSRSNSNHYKCIVVHQAKRADEDGVSNATDSMKENLMPFQNGRDRSILLPTFSQDCAQIVDDDDDPWEKQSGTFQPSAEKIEKIISSTLNGNRGLQRSLTSPNFSSSKNGKDRLKYHRSKSSVNSGMDSLSFNGSVVSDVSMDNDDELFTRENDHYKSVCRPKRARSHSATGIQSSMDENYNFMYHEGKEASCQSIPNYATIGTNTTDSLKRQKTKGKSGRRSSESCAGCDNAMEKRLSAIKPTSFPEQLHSIHLSNFLHDESPEMQVVVNTTSPVISRRSRNREKSKLASLSRQQSETSSCNDDPVDQVVPVIVQQESNSVRNCQDNSVSTIVSHEPESVKICQNSFQSTTKNENDKENQVKHSRTSSFKKEKKLGKGLLRSKSKKKSKASTEAINNSSEGSAIDNINAKERKLMKEELAKTWHGISNKRWKKFYSPVAQAVWNDLEGKHEGQGEGEISQKEEENLRLGSNTVPGRTLLDEMHKKFCAYQYKDRLGLPDDLELPLKLKSSPPPPDRMKSKAWIMRHYIIPPGKGAISTPSSPEQTRRIWMEETSQREATPVELSTSEENREMNEEQEVITNSLWYITNQHQTIYDASLKRKDVTAVPPAFEKYQGYNDVKRKKMKSQPLNQSQLDSHSQALFSILTRPIFGSSKEWVEYKTHITALANCLHNYKVYLDNQLTSQQHRQSLEFPARTVGSDISVEFRKQNDYGVKQKYSLFDQDVKNAKIMEPVMFNEDTHLEKPFANPYQRHTFFEDMQLSVPIDLFRYCPGGSVVTITFAARIDPDRDDKDKVTQPFRVVQQVIESLPVYHTRAQKRQFKQKLENIAKIKPAIADFIYKELALDASAASHPETQQRLNVIALGNTEMVADLRSLNTGRPSDKYDTFFEKLEEEVEKVTAADDRRHGEAHLSNWISLQELIDTAAERCPDGTLIPSKTLVRIQFTPRNPYAHSALNFTGRIPVQYKIQKRQLRADHPDQHFCAAQFKYLKAKAVELGNKGILLCCDDKAKIPVGNHGMPVSTGVRGKKTLVPTSSEIVACDHDMTKSSLCPSVYLKCSTPESVDKSFVRGKVFVAVNDSVLQPSNAFRHGAALCKILQMEDTIPKVILRFSDGGTDQRNTLESVKCSCICLFRELNLDLLVIARCAPGNSWVNPAERIMSILNLGLQNCAFERGDDNGEFKSCNSMNQIREHIEKKPQSKDTWVSSVEPVQSTVNQRFRRLTLKDKPFTCIDPLSEEEIDIFKRHLRELFPGLDLSKLVKSHTKSVEEYQVWLERHCRQRQYSFQVRKCSDPACCLPPETPEEYLEWLPDPTLKDDDKDHYKTYNEIKGQETNEQDRPSFKPPAEKSNIRGATAAKVQKQSIDDQVDASVYTAQTARFTIQCIECNKPRVIYAKNKLTGRQQTQLALLLSEVEYSCGSYITAPNDKLHKTVFVRLGLECSTPVELPYYSSDIGLKDTCCFCGERNGEVLQELKLKFKTVLPICNDCKSSGLKPICQRPFGKKK